MTRTSVILQNAAKSVVLIMTQHYSSMAPNNDSIVHYLLSITSVYNDNLALPWFVNVLLCFACHLLECILHRGSGCTFLEDSLDCKGNNSTVAHLE